MKKPDQCRMISLCSHLFWPPKLVNTNTNLDSTTTSTSSSSSDTEKTDADNNKTITKSNTGIHRFADQPAIYDKSLECMKRAVKVIRDKNLPSSVVEVLDRYVYHLEHENPKFEAVYVSGLIAFINKDFGADLNNSPAVNYFYRNTLAYIKLKQEDANAEVAARFRSIEF
mgnify:CR=1 FL=1